MILGWISGGRPGIFEVLIVVVVLLVFFGAKRLPQLARSLGKSINEFKKGRAEGASSDTEDEPDEAKTEQQGQ